MKDTPRLAGLRQEIAIHVRHLAPMTSAERHVYLDALVGPKTGSASEIDMRAMLMSRLNELKMWPPRKGPC